LVEDADHCGAHLFSELIAADVVGLASSIVKRTGR
jgi:hypothetical protein